jgi:hypothetical protein
MTNQKRLPQLRNKELNKATEVHAHNKIPNEREMLRNDELHNNNNGHSKANNHEMFPLHAHSAKANIGTTNARSLKHTRKDSQSFMKRNCALSACAQHI